jgi:CrcB protein
VLRVALVGFGGAIGSIARYWIAGVLMPWTQSGFPSGTLAVNVTGSLLIGIVIAAAVERQWFSPDLRVALAAGFCGGFTTMSSFSFEMLALLEQGSVGLAFGYAAASVALCLAATWAGIALIRLM